MAQQRRCWMRVYRVIGHGGSEKRIFDRQGAEGATVL